MTSLATSLDPAPLLTPEKDPILGRWRWFNAQIKVFHPDGTVDGDGLHGTWKRAANGTPPKYEINWSDKFVDTLHLVEGGKELKGTNQVGHRISGIRLGPEN